MICAKTNEVSLGIGLNELRASAIRRLAHLHKCAGGVLWLRRGDAFAAIAPCRMPLPATCSEPVDTLFSRTLAEDRIVELDADAARGLTMPAWIRQVPELGLAVPLLAERELIGFIGLQRSLGLSRLDTRHFRTLKDAARQAATMLVRASACAAP